MGYHVEVTCRPIDEWQGAFREPYERRRAPWVVSWARTLNDLRRELQILDAQEVVLGLDVLAGHLRLDGWPRANVAVPPAVMLSFVSSTKGPLRFQCDKWDNWKGNVRAIGLLLQRLRLCDESGVGTGTEQYRGYEALPPGSPIEVEMNLSLALTLLGLPPEPFTMEQLQLAYRAASRLAHPDTGGSNEQMVAVNQAYELLKEHAQ